MSSVRAFWIHVAVLMVKPVLQSICNEEFHTVFPPASDWTKRTFQSSHLEALARSVVGIAPWLELQEDTEAIELAPLARQAIALGTDPNSTQYMDFTGRNRSQPLVDAAFLAQGLLRAPTVLWDRLDSRTKANVVSALRLTREIPPHRNNWMLFPSIIEAFFLKIGEQVHVARLLSGLRIHRTWYLGDGWWGDGKLFAWNYYNSYVIQPMLYDILTALRASRKSPSELFPGYNVSYIEDLEKLINGSLPLSAAILEQMIAPDGSYPPIGRSIVYRGAAFQILALAALKDKLPTDVLPGQARVALTRVINSTLDARAFDSEGWLQIGLVGKQKWLAEAYISTGSLYLASTIFLPLGLPAKAAFWTQSPKPTTWERIWVPKTDPGSEFESGFGFGRESNAGSGSTLGFGSNTPSSLPNSSLPDPDLGLGPNPGAMSSSRSLT